MYSLSRPSALALAAVLLAGVPAGAGLCLKRGRVVVAREQCRKKERPLALDVPVAPGEKGDPGDPGPPGPPGALRILDANGVLVGRAIPTFGDGSLIGLALVATPAGPFVMLVSRNGFAPYHRSPQLHYENTTCTGTPYLEVGKAAFHRLALVAGADAYYPQEPIALHTFGSQKRVGQTCELYSDTLEAGPAGTFPVSSLAFTPPFSLPFP
jgi:hypothetical protein